MTEIEQLRAALKAACDDLEADVRARYGMSQGQVALHPVEQRRFDRDMRVIEGYRVLLPREGG